MTDRSPESGYGMYPPAADADGDDDNLLRHYATVLRRRIRWVVMGVALGLVAGLVSTLIITAPPNDVRYYKATNTLVPAAAGSIGDVANGNQLLQQALLYAQSAELLSQLEADTALSREQLVKQLSADLAANANLPAIDVTAIATSPDMAVQIADDAADGIIALVAGEDADDIEAQKTKTLNQIQQLQDQEKTLVAQVAANPDDTRAATELEDIRVRITEAQSQLAQLDSDGPPTLATLQPAMATPINAAGYQYRVRQNTNARNPLATTTSSNSGPDFDETDLSVEAPMSNTTRIALGGAAGLVFGLITAFIIEAWDDRLRKRDVVETITGLGVIAEIPRLSRDEAREHHLTVADEPRGVIAERYRGARTAIQFLLDEREDGAGTPVVLVTSPSPNEGKTTTSANLAAAFAEAGTKTLVIDADFRRPTIRRFLAPTTNMVIPDEPTETRVSGLWYLPGPHNADSPEEAIATLKAMIPPAREGFDLVVLDTPPILTTNDAADLLGSADEVLLVLRSGQTRKRAARRVTELLARFRIEPLGVVLNACDRREMDPYYGYNYGYYLRSGAKGSGEASTGAAAPPHAPQPDRPSSGAAAEVDPDDQADHDEHADHAPRTDPGTVPAPGRDEVDAEVEVDAGNPGPGPGNAVRASRS